MGCPWAFLDTFNREADSGIVGVSFWESIISLLLYTVQLVVYSRVGSAAQMHEYRHLAIARWVTCDGCLFVQVSYAVNPISLPWVDPWSGDHLAFRRTF